jgi:hypothetical protein
MVASKPASTENAKSVAKIARDAAVCARAGNRNRPLSSVFFRGEADFKKWRVSDKEEKRKT